MKVLLFNGSPNLNGCTYNALKVVKESLEKNGIEYDEIFFGKPNADITIDDRVVRFNDNWQDMTEENLSKAAKAK